MRSSLDSSLGNNIFNFYMRILNKPLLLYFMEIIEKQFYLNTI